MARNYLGKQISLEVYHGVPKGWYAAEVIAEHALLCGTYDIRGPEATEPGAPAWLPERYEWLQYRATVYRIADGVRADDPACIELAVRFIELRHIGSYSGFLRERLSRCLRHAALTPELQDRLHWHFRDLVRREEMTNEFREYLRLWRRIITDAQVHELRLELERYAAGKVRPMWLLNKLRPNGGFDLTNCATASRAP